MAMFCGSMGRVAVFWGRKFRKFRKLGTAVYVDANISAAWLKHDCRYVRLSWTSTRNASYSLIGQLYPISCSRGLAGGPAQLFFEKDEIREGIYTMVDGAERIGLNG
jgi:hypothetical protein